ncbi:MAG TPA: nucleotide disphospho-sugar-binding domain-containing protein [Candidatus Competibacteraceae bacterium]|nr:nucleotide disphospho-sugar-binding domain-containing protein [Candidatus Competibacteraceae bacterium]
MNRFLFTTFGSLGDLYPYLAIGRVLHERGHQAVIATVEEYRQAVADAGLEFAPVRPSLAELGDPLALARRVLEPRRGPEYLIRRVVMPHVRAAYEQLLPLSTGADLLISHPLTFALPLVARQRGLPWVATVLSPLSLMSCHDPPVIAAAPWLHALRGLGPRFHRFLFRVIKRAVWPWESPLRELRRALGLPPSSHLAMFEGQFSPLCNIALFDPLLATPQPDWPPAIQLCGAPLYEERRPAVDLAPELDSFLDAGEAPVVFALGSSAVWVADDFWDKAAAAVQHLGKRALLITGPVEPVLSIPGVRAFPYLPYARVFPRAAVVAHSAGIGTLAQALRAGCPQLLVPLAFDQPDNAYRAAALGVARRVPFAKVTVRRLVSELDALLTQPDYARAARRVADELATTDGAACAADVLVARLDGGAHRRSRSTLDD